MFALLLFVARFFFVRKGGKQYPIKKSYILRIISNERCIIAIEGYFVNPLLGSPKEINFLVKRIPFNTILLKSLLPNNPPTNTFQKFSHDSAKSNIQENCSTLHPNVTTHDKTADCCPFWQLSTGANVSSAINVRHVLTSFFANSSKVGRIWPEVPSTVSYGAFVTNPIVTSRVSAASGTGKSRKEVSTPFFSKRGNDLRFLLNFVTINPKQRGEGGVRLFSNDCKMSFG